MSDHYQFMRHEIDTLKVGLDSLHAEHERVVAERDQLRRDLAGNEAAAVEIDRLEAERDALTTSLHAMLADKSALTADNGRLRRDLAETRERLGYHMRIACESRCLVPH